MNNFIDYFVMDRFQEAKAYDYVSNLQKIRTPILTKIKTLISDYFPTYQHFQDIIYAIDTYILIHELSELKTDERFKNISAIIDEQITENQNILDKSISNFDENYKNKYFSLIKLIDFNKTKQLMDELNTKNIAKVLFKDQLTDADSLSMLVIELNSKIKSNWNDDDIKHFNSKYKQFYDKINSLQSLINEYFKSNTKSVGPLTGTRILGSTKTVQELNDDEITNMALKILQHGMPSKQHEIEIVDKFNQMELKMPYGKYKDIPLNKIIKDDKKYIKWLFNQITDKPKNKLTPFDSYFIRYVADELLI